MLKKIERNIIILTMETLNTDKIFILFTKKDINININIDIYDISKHHYKNIKNINDEIYIIDDDNKKKLVGCIIKK